LPTGAIQGSAPAGTVTQNITINSQHPNPGHYSVASDFTLGVALHEVTIYQCASSQEEAEAIVNDLYHPQPLPSSVSLAIIEPAGTTASMDSEGQILIQAQITHDLAGFPFDYPVEARVEYLDVPSGLTESFDLFDSGTTDHGDAVKADGIYSARWKPQVGGQARLTVTVDPPGLLEPISASKIFSVDLLPDFVVTKVYQNPNSLKYGVVTILAEIQNIGSSIDGPVDVDFRYYRMDPDTAEPVGDPIHVARKTILDGEEFSMNQRVRVSDSSFSGTDPVPYFVEVVVDP